jgi:hypothetical protein
MRARSGYQRAGERINAGLQARNEKAGETEATVRFHSTSGSDRGQIAKSHNLECGDLSPLFVGRVDCRNG